MPYSSAGQQPYGGGSSMGGGGSGRNAGGLPTSYSTPGPIMDGTTARPRLCRHARAYTDTGSG